MMHRILMGKNSSSAYIIFLGTIVSMVTEGGYAKQLSKHVLSLAGKISFIAFKKKLNS